MNLKDIEVGGEYATAGHAVTRVRVTAIHPDGTVTYEPAVSSRALHCAPSPPSELARPWKDHQAIKKRLPDAVGEFEAELQAADVAAESFEMMPVRGTVLVELNSEQLDKLTRVLARTRVQGCALDDLI